MPSYNKVTVMGNLTRDPEIKYTPKGTAVAECSIAINRTVHGENGASRQEATYVEVTLWGKTAELANQKLSKGSAVFIEGRLQTETWDDRQTGQRRSKLKVVGEFMQFVGTPPASRQAPAPEQTPQPRKTLQQAADELSDEDIPF